MLLIDILSHHFLLLITPRVLRFRCRSSSMCRPPTLPCAVWRSPPYPHLNHTQQFVAQHRRYLQSQSLRPDQPIDKQRGRGSGWSVSLNWSQVSSVKGLFPLQLCTCSNLSLNVNRALQTGKTLVNLPLNPARLLNRISEQAPTCLSQLVARGDSRDF